MAQSETFDEACLFEKPCGGKFDMAFGGGPVGNLGCGNLQIVGNSRQS